MSPAPTSTAPRLDELLCFDLYAASRALTAAYRTVLDDVGLTYPQYLVLTVLWSDGESPIKHLAASLQLDHGTLSPLLRRMEAVDLVRRRAHAGDQRNVMVDVGGRGEDLREIAPRVQRSVAAAMGLDPEQVQQLRSLVRTMTSNVLSHDDAARS